MGKVGRVGYYEEEERKFRVLTEELEVLLKPIKGWLGGRIWLDIRPAGMTENAHIHLRPGRDVLRFVPQDYLPSGMQIAAKLEECHGHFGQLDRLYRSLSDSEKEEVGRPPQP
jgi:hypothetical protein